jgi:ABC-type branched-subunit amino acid transport system ATPase component
MPTLPPEHGRISYQEHATTTLPPSSSANIQENIAYQTMADFNAYTMFDQYVPYQQNVEGDMQVTQDQGWPVTTSAEFDFMNNAYHDRGQYDMGNDFTHGNPSS